MRKTTHPTSARRRGRFAAMLLLLALFAAAPGPAAAGERRPRTIDGLRAAAARASASPPERKIKVLIVPGHEPGAGGTAHRALKERDLNVALAKDLERFLDADGRFEALRTRDEKAWSPELAAYFAAHWDGISRWREEVREAFDRRVAAGEVARPVVHVDHNKAPNDMAVRLYGITRWANENDVDLMLHVHFDDERSSWRAAGRRTGFTVYVPPPEYANGRASRAIAEKVRSRLSAFDPVSDMRAVARLGGVVDDPQLIALGKNDSSDAASLLIEYAYIYERHVQTPAIRPLVVEDMAYRTYLGLRDLFFDGKGEGRPFPTTVLPHSWKRPLAGPADVFALQTALMVEGLYPPPGKSKNACPRTGVIGPCTREALRRFQAKHGIAGERGQAGERTIEKLNALYAK